MGYGWWMCDTQVRESDTIWHTFHVFCRHKKLGFWWMDLLIVLLE